MMSISKPLPLPASDSKQYLEDRRLWIGNLDPRITEFQLLKITQKYGAIEKFDLLFHKSGPLAGQPRGYAFVTYSNKEDAEHMKEELHGKQLGSKCVSVRWAHSMDKVDVMKPKTEAAIPALGVKVEKKISPSLQIKAIEAKLKMMEHTSTEEFSVSNVPSSSRVTSQLINSTKKHIRNHKKTNGTHFQPYRK